MPTLKFDVEPIRKRLSDSELTTFSQETVDTVKTVASCGEDGLTLQGEPDGANLL
jgi:hypothetical protein